MLVLLWCVLLGFVLCFILLFAPCFFVSALGFGLASFAIAFCFPLMAGAVIMRVLRRLACCHGCSGSTSSSPSFLCSCSCSCLCRLLLFLLLLWVLFRFWFLFLLSLVLCGLHPSFFVLPSWFLVLRSLFSVLSYLSSVFFSLLRYCSYRCSHSSCESCSSCACRSCSHYCSRSVACVVCPLVCLSVCLCVCLSGCFCFCCFVWLFVFLCVFVCLFVCLCVLCALSVWAGLEANKFFWSAKSDFVPAHLDVRFGFWALAASSPQKCQLGDFCPRDVPESVNNQPQAVTNTFGL